MLTTSQVAAARERAAAYLEGAAIKLTPPERMQIEIADFGMGRLDETGLELLVYVNDQRYCAKELVLFPRQTCPEHRHPPFEGTPGKQETFRCRWGEVFLYVEGNPVTAPRATPPLSGVFTAWHEIAMLPGDQYTIPPNTLHWFQGGDSGAVVSEFSSQSRDDLDVFSDPEVKRQTDVVAG